MRRFAPLLLAPLLVATLGGCTDDDGVDVGAGSGSSTTAAVAAPSVPDRAADIVGTITSVTPFVPVTEGCTPADEVDPDGVTSSDDPPVCTDPDLDLLGTVLVEEQPDVQEGRKIVLSIEGDTPLAGVASFDDLAVGQRVEGFTTGACAESYPEQCGAEGLVLIAG